MSKSVLLYNKRSTTWKQSKCGDAAQLWSANGYTTQSLKCPSCFTTFSAKEAHQSTRVFSPDHEPYAVCRWCHMRETRTKAVRGEWN